MKTTGAVLAEYGWFTGKATLLHEAMEAYADQFKPKWIPITDRLPEKYIEVSVLVGRKGWEPYKHTGQFMNIEDYSTGEYKNVWYLNGKPIIKNETVTHWCEMPA